MKTDVNRDAFKVYLHTVGLYAVTIFSVNSDWSPMGLKLV